MKDRGSRATTAMVSIQGVEVHGIVDTGADITIMGPELLKKVDAVAHLKEITVETGRQDTLHLRPQAIQTGWKTRAGYHFPRADNVDPSLP